MHLVAPAVDGVEQGQLRAGVRAFAAHDEPGAVRESVGGHEAGEFADLGAVAQVTVDIEGGDPVVGLLDGVADSSVIATPTEKKVRMPSARWLRMWAVSTNDGTSTTNYHYTPRGTMDMLSATSTQTMQTDAFGQTVTHQYAAGQQQTYSYDALGRVVVSGMAYTGLDNDLANDGAATYVRDPATASSASGPEPTSVCCGQTNTATSSASSPPAAAP